MPVLASDDAFGAALADHAAGRPGPKLILEVDDGYRTPALPPAWFFIVAGTGWTVVTHLVATVDNYLVLRQWA